jgi:hypothetical protein
MAAGALVQSYRELCNAQPAPRDEALLRARLMQAQKRARTAYGLAPLVWDNALVASARSYAGVLARENRVAHDPQSGVFIRQGENLWKGTRGAFDYATMVADWIDERKNFKTGLFPDVSGKEHWTIVSHFTQIVWPTTTRLGCAIDSNARDDYLVCRYLPAGNVSGVVMR